MIKSKMFVQLPIALSLLLSSMAAYAAPVAPAEALHTSLHRVEKLVALNKLDGSYSSLLQSGAVELLPAGTGSAPVYKVTLTQLAGAQGAARAVEILTDATGKEISHKETNASATAATAIFTGVDAITLIEYAYHYVNANGDVAKPGVKTELVPFYAANIGVSLSKGVNAAGEVAGVVEFSSSKTNKTLRIVVNVDTSIDSVQVVN